MDMKRIDGAVNIAIARRGEGVSALTVGPEARACIATMSVVLGTC